ncbi:MAG: UDP-N-acetylglucosamine--N-acetylmuramyl-(pentapeptide) pyrophosphoryl-undecaprenol N-acetylglucosamine transferase, partial [Gemmatimonadales bacterium]
NPIVPPPDPRPNRAEARAGLGVPTDRPVLLVVGGSQGALSINRAVAAALAAGALDGVTLLWSTGRHSWERYRSLDAPPARRVRAFWDPIGEAYAAADLVVARSGAMTTAELLAWRLPAILVPLPRAAANHQYHNALAVAAAGAALHLPDHELRPDRLAAEVRRLLDAPDRLRKMGRAAAARGRPKAAEEIAKRLLAVVS